MILNRNMETFLHLVIQVVLRVHIFGRSALVRDAVDKSVVHNTQ